jgi:hypothetical protein
MKQPVHNAGNAILLLLIATIAVVASTMYHLKKNKITIQQSMHWKFQDIANNGIDIIQSILVSSKGCNKTFEGLTIDWTEPRIENITKLKNQNGNTLFSVDPNKRFFNNRLSLTNISLLTKDITTHANKRGLVELLVTFKYNGAKVLAKDNLLTRTLLLTAQLDASNSFVGCTASVGTNNFPEICEKVFHGSFDYNNNGCSSAYIFGDLRVEGKAFTKSSIPVL